MISVVYPDVNIATFQRGKSQRDNQSIKFFKLFFKLWVTTVGKKTNLLGHDKHFYKMQQKKTYRAAYHGVKVSIIHKIFSFTCIRVCWIKFSDVFLTWSYDHKKHEIQQ